MAKKITISENTQKYILNIISTGFSLEEAARLANLSKAELSHLKKMKGFSSAMELVKLEKEKELLESWDRVCIVAEEKGNHRPVQERLKTLYPEKYGDKQGELNDEYEIHVYIPENNR